MSLQSDLNYYPAQFVVYYCNSPAGQNDPTLYDYQGLSNICTFGYDGLGNFEVLTWLIGGYGAPSTATLLSYTLANVLNFYNNFYIVPAAIAANEPYMISTSDLANIRADSTMLGYVVYDTTAQATKYWSGTSWDTTASRFLSMNGGMLLGNLDMDAHNIIDVNNITVANPSALSIWSSASSSISFTANTPRLISIGSFSQTVNPNSDFTYTSSSGQCKYTGSATRYFRVTINYSVTALAVADTLTNFISYNSSTSVTGVQNVVTYLLLGSVTTSSYSLTDVIRLANNDTIQLAANNSTTGSITYQAVSYVISAV